MSLPQRPKGNADKYLKLEPDTHAEGVLLGKPSFFYRRFENGKYEYADEHEAGFAFRFQLNFIQREQDKDGNFKLTPKVFENGGPFYDKLQEFSSSYDVEKTWVKITRKGSGKDTRYDFMPLPDHKVTEAEAEVLNKAELHQLRGIGGAGFKSFEEAQDDAFL